MEHLVHWYGIGRRQGLHGAANGEGGAECDITVNIKGGATNSNDKIIL